ncbi:hypothetical protein TSMEX_004445 [Taenia solium]|eukprot:TsM_000311400 transcript=TsM_000311400 gene=TsM_000311400
MGRFEASLATFYPPIQCRLWLEKAGGDFMAIRRCLFGEEVSGLCCMQLRTVEQLPTHWAASSSLNCGYRCDRNMGKRNPTCLRIGVDVAHLRMPSKNVFATATESGSGFVCPI